MKQLRWVWILGITAVLLVGIFIVVDQRTKQKEEEARIGEPKQLLSIDSNAVTRITIDNEDGHFAFDWDSGWKLVSQEQFQINTYAVAAICNYICDVRSEKTVAFDCKDPSVYGFDHPVTLKVYTADTDADHPYILYVGDSTPTYDAYYAMVDGSDDVYTIDYNSGSIFCVAKDSLKNTYLYDVPVSGVEYYRLERDGKTVTEISRDTDGNWQLNTPAGYDIHKSNIDDLFDDLGRASVSGFVEEHPEDLAQYGLEQPHTKLYLEGTSNAKPFNDEIWFGSNTSSSEDALEMFGYSKSNDQVFVVRRADVAFIEAEPSQYMLPYCINVAIENLSQIEIDMGDVYDMHEVLYLDYANTQYSLGGTDITALKNEETMSLFTAYYRAIAYLSFSELELTAKPDPEAEPVIRIIYTFLDGSTSELCFVEKEQNNYYLLKDGTYTGMTVRLNRFTGTGCIVETYEALEFALRQ